MNLKELDEFRLENAVKFNTVLNPALFKNDRLDSEVRNQLLLIAKDFMAHLGVKDLDVKDITLSGSNAAFTYTPHSDIDLHIIVDIAKLRNDEVYRELFNSKKVVFNDSHDIKIHGYDVELYVQDAMEPVKSLGEYSVMRDKWIKYPSKKIANFDEFSAREKFKKLIQLIELALRSRDIKKIDRLLDTIRKYRQAGLSQFGEFGAENLAYKALRSKGIIDNIYKHRDALHSTELSLKEENVLPAPTLTVDELSIKYGLPKEKILHRLMKGTSIELEHTDDEEIAKKSALNNLIKDINYYVKLKSSSAATEDYDPNGKPPGPEFKPTMPAGTVKVDVSDVYDWYKLGQHISNLKGLGKHDFGKGPPSTIMAFGSEDEEHKYIDALEKTGLTTTDIDPLDPKQPKGIKRQKVDTTYNVSEASGYIPSEKEKNDWRFKTALTVDVKPSSIKDNAKKLGLGNIKRAGIPPIAKSSGKI